MSLNQKRSSEIKYQLMKIPEFVETVHAYCDKRVDGKQRHKVEFRFKPPLDVGEVTERIKSIIKESYYEAEPYVRRSYPLGEHYYIEFVWISEKNPYINEALKLILENKGQLITSGRVA